MCLWFSISIDADTDTANLKADTANVMDISPHFKTTLVNGFVKYSIHLHLLPNFVCVSSFVICDVIIEVSRSRAMASGNGACKGERYAHVVVKVQTLEHQQHD